MAEFQFATLEPLGQTTSNRDAASAIVASARAEAELIRATAHAEGFASGRAAAAAGVEPAAAAFDRGLAEMAARSEALADRLEREAVDLAFLLAAKVLGAAVDADPGAVLEAIRSALRGVVARERVTLLVHPDDLELVRGAMAGLLASLGGVEHCEVQAERRVARGGALLHHPDGIVDATLETKLERAREVVVQALAAEPAGGAPVGRSGPPGAG